MEDIIDGSTTTVSRARFWLWSIGAAAFVVGTEAAAAGRFWGQYTLWFLVAVWLLLEPVLAGAAVGIVVERLRPAALWMLGAVVAGAIIVLQVAMSVPDSVFNGCLIPASTPQPTSDACLNPGIALRILPYFLAASWLAGLALGSRWARRQNRLGQLLPPTLWTLGAVTVGTILVLQIAVALPYFAVNGCLVTHTCLDLSNALLVVPYLLAASGLAVLALEWRRDRAAAHGIAPAEPWRPARKLLLLPASLLLVPNVVSYAASPVYEVVNPVVQHRLHPGGDPGGRILAELMRVDRALPRTAAVIDSRDHESTWLTCRTDTRAGWDDVTTSISFTVDPSREAGMLDSIGRALVADGWRDNGATTPGSFGAWTKQLPDGAFAEVKLERYRVGSGGWLISTTAPAEGQRYPDDCI